MIKIFRVLLDMKYTQNKFQIKVRNDFKNKFAIVNYNL